jgi:hypothetical protein
MNHRERVEAISSWIHDQEKTRKQLEAEERGRKKQLLKKAEEDYAKTKSKGETNVR